MEYTKGVCGFTPREDGYVSKCDLCQHVRQVLHATGDFPELQPASFYDELPVEAQVASA
jgi:hypothetical protein